MNRIINYVVGFGIVALLAACVSEAPLPEPQVMIDKSKANTSLSKKFDNKDLSDLLEYSQKLFPNESNLPNSNDVKNKQWSPPKVDKINSAFYEPRMRMNQEGTVKVAMLISENVEVIKSKIVDTENPNLNQSALITIRKWKFFPATLEGKTCKSVLIAPIQFRLSPEQPEPSVETN